MYANLTDISEVVEIDAKTATVSRRWSTDPCKQPVSMAIDTAHRRLFSGCRSGVLAISDYQAGKVVATGEGAVGIGGEPINRRIYVPSAKFGEAPAGRGRPPVLPGPFALIVIER